MLRLAVADDVRDESQIQHKVADSQGKRDRKEQPILFQIGECNESS